MEHQIKFNGKQTNMVYKMDKRIVKEKATKLNKR